MARHSFTICIASLLLIGWMSLVSMAHKPKVDISAISQASSLKYSGSSGSRSVGGQHGVPQHQHGVSGHGRGGDYHDRNHDGRPSHGPVHDSPTPCQEPPKPKQLCCKDLKQAANVTLDQLLGKWTTYGTNTGLASTKRCVVANLQPSSGPVVNFAVTSISNDAESSSAFLAYYNSTTGVFLTNGGATTGAVIATDNGLSYAVWATCSNTTRGFDYAILVRDSAFTNLPALNKAFDAIQSLIGVRDFIPANLNCSLPVAQPQVGGGAAGATGGTAPQR